MIPFDGTFAQDTVYPLAFGAYDAEQPPPGYASNVTAFDILADLGKVQARLQELDKTDPRQRHRKPLEAMLKHSRKPRILTAEQATTAAVAAMAPSPVPNNHFGWVCIDQANARLIVCFRGTEYFKDWLDDFDFAPAPYSAIPGRGTVHQGFQIVYEAVRDNVRALVTAHRANCREILITGHSLGGALSALAAPDLLNDVASNLAPTVYTWAEPRVGHPDYVQFFDARVNICYRIVNLWDVVPHLPPLLALYEHEGHSLHIDSGFSLDIVHNHVLVTGYAPGIAKWNQDHPATLTRFGVAPLFPLVGRSA
jgi:triacylglycerol lipase